MLVYVEPAKHVKLEDDKVDSTLIEPPECSRSTIPLSLPEKEELLDGSLGYRVTSKTSVEHIQVLHALPSCWDIPRRSTAYILNLTGSDTVPGAGTLDHWIKDKVCS